MIRQRLVVTIASFILLISTISASAQSDFEIINESEFGKFSVGFQCHWKLDATRAYSTQFDEGKTYGKEKSPRPILVNLWYPAEKNTGKGRVTFGEYIDSIRQPDLENLHAYSDALVEYAAEIVVYEMFGKTEAELNDRERKLLAQFREAPSNSIRDATPRAETYPIVIYHSGAGSSFDDNAVFCEWLASFGYIVVGSAFPKGNGTTLGIDAGDDSAQDIGFLIDYAAKHANGDIQRVAVVGHSAGAQAALHYVSAANHLADTVVLLDTTMDYYGYPIVERTWRGLVDRLNRSSSDMKIPMLVAAGAGASYQLVDQISSSERTLLTVPFLDHNDFISQGIFSNLFKTRLADKGSDELSESQEHFSRVESTYLALNGYVLGYLEQRLKGSDKNLERLNQRFGTEHQESDQLHVKIVNGGVAGPASYQSDSPHPPTPRQLLKLISSRDAEETIGLIKRFEKQPSMIELIQNNMLVGSALFELVQTQQIAKAKKLYNYLMNINPKVLSAIRFQGDWAVMRKRYPDAKQFYETLLIFDPNNAQYAEKLKQLPTLDH